MERYSGTDRRGLDVANNLAINDKLDRILQCLYGDDSEDKPGLKVQVDRLTQAKNRQDYLHATWFAIVIAWLLDKFGGQ